MKFVIALAALLAVACGKQWHCTFLGYKNVSIFNHLFVAAPTPKPARPTPAKGDFRNEFDHLIVAAAVQRFHDLEEFLLKLSEQVADLEKTKNKEEKAKILREITIADGLVVGGRTYFEKEVNYRFIYPF